MRQIIFDDIRSWNDLGLFLTDVQTAPPEPKRNTLSVDGMDGELDLTYGTTKRVRFGNKSTTLTFTMKDYMKGWDETFSKIRNRLHAKRMKVVVDEDSGFYQDAYVTVSSTKGSGNQGTVTVTLDAYPYDYRDDMTIYPDISLTTAGVTVTCANGEMDVIPTFTSTGTFTVISGSRTVTFDGAGEHESADIVFEEGANEITLKGQSGVTVTISYREGRL